MGKAHRKLNLLDIFSIAAGAMISSGIFIIPGLAFKTAGPSILFSYFLAGILAFTGLLSISELSSAMPKSGGDYYYITRSLGPMVGTVSGLSSWFALCLKSSFALIGIAEFGIYFFNFDIRFVAVIFSLIFTLVNIVGVKNAGKTQVGMVAFVLFFVSVFALITFKHVNPAHFKPFASHGIMPMIAAAGYVFVSYGGLLKIASMAEEVENPSKNIPIGLLVSLVSVMVIYIGTVFLTIGVLPAGVLESSLTPVSDAANISYGRPGAYLFAFVAVIAFFATANAGIMAASRYPFALSKDKLLPSLLGRENAKFQTPHYSILLTGAFVTSAIFLEVDMLIKAASTVLIVNYILSNLSVVVLRESGILNYRPTFKTPLYPLPQILGTIGFAFIIINMGNAAILISIVLITFSLFVFLFYGMKRSAREYALLHIIERITSKELTSRFLENELREVIRERDNIVEDKFDKLVKESDFIDMKEKTDYEGLFRIISERISTSTGIQKDEIFSKLMDREKKYGTTISEDIAIPHIVIDGEKIFRLFIVRNPEGIFFDEEHSRVKSIFILVGTLDERNFHLRALASIAQIVTDSHFDDNWCKAKHCEDLKDIMLLSKRRRS
ncbi:MAG: amino acid permease [bacterium]|nr:amino acid permease [bacterium]